VNLVATAFWSSITIVIALVQFTEISNHVAAPAFRVALIKEVLHRLHMILAAGIVRPCSNQVRNYLAHSGHAFE
jgi:hypothetical protein